MNSLPGILVVDDQQHMLRLLEFNLRPLRARLHFAPNAEQALEISRRETEGIHLAIVDYEMPGLNGFSFVAQFRQLPSLCDAPIIMLTSNGQTSVRREAESMGIDAFLTKPFSPKDLIVLIQSLISSRDSLKLE